MVQVTIPGQRPLAVPNCPNCGEVTSARMRYCSGCGQRQGESLLTVRALVGDLVEDVFALDGKLPRTLHGLLFRPGHLTRDYSAGRVVRYIRPFKLYLASSVIFFLALSLSIKFDVPSLTGERSAPNELMFNFSSSPDSVIAPAGGADAPDIAAVSKRSMSKGQVAFERFIAPFQEEIAKDADGAARRLIDHMLDDAPKAVFVLLPIFALFLKVLYIRRRRLYVEHLVFVLHVHSFGFLLAALLLLVPDNWPTGLLWLIPPAYLLWAMKRVYGQSWAKTIFKCFTFGWAYFFSVIVTLVAVTIIAALAVGGTVTF